MPKNKGLAEVSISPDLLPGLVTGLVTGCGICVAFCHGQALTLEQERNLSPRFLAPRFLWKET